MDNLYKKIILFVFLAFMAGGTAYAQTSDEYFVMAKNVVKDKGDFAKAAQYCEKALELAPLDMDIKEFLGKCYMELGRYQEARVTLLEVLQKSPRRTDARHYLINIDTREERYASAVCYVNELLEITPYSKTLWQRKISLYNLMDNRIEANREIRRLYQIYPNDEDIKAMYNNVLKEDALKMNKSGDLSSAVKQYEAAMLISPNDPEVYLNLINLYTKMGNTEAALSTADRGLYYLPNNREILNKKIGILEQQHRYQEAITLVEAQLKTGSSTYYSDLLFYLRSEAARHYRNSDPYTLYGQLYETNKGNTEAHDYLLNTAISRGYYNDAQTILTQDLKSNPNDKVLLSKQLLVYENVQDRKGYNRTLTRLYELYPNDADIVAKYNEMSFEEAKVQFNERNFKEALPAFIRLSENPDYGKASKSYIFSIYVARQEYEEALVLADEMIAEYPGESVYVIRKIDLLAAMEDYSDAYEMARNYKDQNPDVPEYRYLFKDISVAYIKYLNERQAYDSVKTVADALIEEEPKNIMAYNYAIGARINMGQYDEAMALIKEAKQKFPNNRDMRLKEAGVYSQMGEHEQAIAALKALSDEYPYNHDLKGSLIEEMMLRAKLLEEDDEPFQAKSIYEEVLLIKPSDTLAALKLANIYIARQEYPEAMRVVENSLKLNKDNNELLYKKGVIYELMGDYRRAREFQGKYNPPTAKYQEHKEHLAYIDAQLLKNQINIAYLKATSDSILINTSVATLEYMRFAGRNTYVGRVNYAGRPTGVGVQGEADWYHTFKGESYQKKSYMLANVGVSNQFFPKFKASLSYFEPFKRYYIGEVGIKYSRLQDDRNFFTGVLGIERSYDRLWVNAKVMLMSDTDDFYNSIFAQGRFYLEDNRDYVTAMASIGTAPENEVLEFQINTFLTYVNTMVGGGYFHALGDRTTMGVMGNWYNYRVADNAYINQYNLYFTIRTKF